jgi:hypothetical protein
LTLRARNILNLDDALAFKLWNFISLNLLEPRCSLSSFSLNLQ